ncbi:PrgI family protein [Candidatus Uhrbacteria bacterium]|nr:PrgI family protein [Candidatus Uhrbacteria bacterium]
MRYTVPQFIDVEDKILGPITVRQFVILIVAGLIMFIEYKLFDFAAFLLLAILTFAVGGTLAFFRVNGQPFHYFLLNLAQTMTKPRMRVWDKEFSDGELRGIMAVPPPPPVVARVHKEPLGSSKLSELSLVVNTGGVYNPEED